VTVVPLRIRQEDSSLFATVTWNSGAIDTAVGLVRTDGTIVLGLAGMSQFRFQGMVDTAGRLNGFFNDSLRRIWGNAQGLPGACGPDTVPPPAAKVCYAFSQAQADGKTVQGRLGFELHGTWAQVHTHWSGYGSASAATLELIGDLDSSGLAWWPVAPPPAGLFSAGLGVDSAGYQLSFPGGRATGKIMKLNPPTRSVGTVTGTRSPCLDSDFRL
jgi:hypothetical protein